MAIILIALLTLVLILILINVLFVPWEMGPGFRSMKLLRKIPGPRKNPLIGVAYEMSFLKNDELMDFLINLSKDFPRLCKVWIGCLPFVMVKEAEDLEVIMGNVNNIQKGVEYHTLGDWLKEGLLLSSGSKWHSRRKLLTPTFHFKILQDNMTSINKQARILLKNLAKLKDEPVEVKKYVTLCTLDIICETAMGIELNSQENEDQEYVKAVKKATEIVVERALKMWLFRPLVFYLTLIGRQFKEQLKILHTFSENIIHERRKQYFSLSSYTEGESQNESKKRKAFLDSLIEMDLKNPNSFTVNDIKEEVDTFMFEGHDTTSAAITFSIFLLGHHPNIQEKAYQEQYSIFGDSDREVTQKDLLEMNYLEKIIKEVLRLYPSVPYMSRCATKDIVLKDGTIIPEKTGLLLIPYLVHRNERFFPNPEVFDPERFAPEECAKRHPFAYIPFSAGPRNCIGQRFAMMELKTVLSTLIRFAKMKTLTKLEDMKIEPVVILKTSVPIKAQITLRPFKGYLFD